MSEGPSIPGYSILDEVATGPTGTVYRATLEGQDLECAVKVFRGVSVNRQYLSYCLGRLFAGAQHEGIQDFFGGDLNNAPYYVSSAWLPDSLATREEVVRSQDLAWRIIRETAEALAFLHRNGILHCNLTLDNVRLTGDEPPNPKLTDFGLGWIGGVHELDFVQHAFYLSPEQLRSPDQISGGQGERWDVYSFGVLAFRLLTGRFPRAERHIAEYMRLAHGATPGGAQPGSADFAALLEADPEVAWPDASDDRFEAARRDVLIRCLALDPAQRFADMREVVEAFRRIDHEAELADQARRIEAGVDRWRRRTRRARSMAGLAGLGLLAAAGGAGWLWFERENAREIAAAAEGKIAEVEQSSNVVIRQMESEAAEAMARGALAEQKGEEARRMADEFFDFVQSFSPRDGFQGERLDAALAAAEQFYRSRVDSPDVADPASLDRARAELSLARILARKEGPERAEALPVFAAASGRFVNWLDANPTGPSRGDVIESLASAKVAMAKLQSDLGDADAAIATLDEFAQKFAPIAEEEVDSNLLRRMIGDALFWKGRTLVERMRLSAASDALEAALRWIDPLAGLESASADDRFLQAEITHELGVVRRLDGVLEEAVEMQINAVESLLALTGDFPDEPEFRFELSQCYGELGRSVMQVGNSKDASRAHTEAIKILAELVKAFPDRDDFGFQLAVEYGEVSTLVRDAGNRAKAVEYQDGAVAFLREIQQRNPDNLTYAVELSRQEGRQAELLVDQGKRPEAVEVLRGAIARIEENADGGTDPTRQQSNLRRALARLYGSLGHATEESAEKALAIDSFTKAVEQWEFLASSSANGVPGEEVRQGLDWSRERLKRLQP